MVSAAEMLSIAAFLEGRYAQAFPSFGSERMGAPVMAFCRISDQPIRLREPVAQPDALIIQDPTLLIRSACSTGCRRDGYVLINSTRSLEELGIGFVFQNLPPDHVLTVPATELALRYVGRPLPNSTLLGRICRDDRRVADRIRAGCDPAEVLGQDRRGQRRRGAEASRTS